MGRRLSGKRPGAIVLLIIVGLVLLGALASYMRNNSAGAGKNYDAGELGGQTERQNRGWKWAERVRVNSAVQCEELEDSDEKSGCEAYVIFVSAQSATSP